MSKINPFISSILKEIHDNIYLNIQKETVDVFLCGGADKKRHIRDQVRDNLSKNKRIRVLYPEDLFLEILARNKSSDLLSLENFLANNSDFICIICESPGSFVELGAFTNHSEIKKKLVVVVNSEFKRAKSFIMMGPIKLIQRMGKNRVFFKEKDKVLELSAKLGKHFSSSIHSIKKQKDISSLIGLNYFIPIVLYFFKSIYVSDLKSMIKSLYIELGHNTDNLDINYISSLKLNFKENNIKKVSLNNKQAYELTDIGYNTLLTVFNNADIINTSKTLDRIRFRILNNNFYK